MEDTTRLTGPWIFLAALRFAAELGMLAALAYVGWRSADGGLPGVVLAVALPVLAGSVWGRWVAPRASKRLTDPARLAVELVLFGATVIGLVAVGAAATAPVALGLAYAVSAPVGRKGF